MRDYQRLELARSSQEKAGMKKIATKKKLTLDREKLRELTADALKGVAGGSTLGSWINCPPPPRPSASNAE
jgi:hypothetical protein